MTSSTSIEPEVIAADPNSAVEVTRHAVGEAAEGGWIVSCAPVMQ